MAEVCRALVLKENQVESAEARGIGEHVDLGDLSALDSQAENDARPSARGLHGSGAPVDERRSRKPGTPREDVGYGRRAHSHGRVVGPEHDVRVEQRQQCAEIAVARGG
jgi:hypothetical protein